MRLLRLLDGSWAPITDLTIDGDGGESGGGTTPPPATTPPVGSGTGGTDGQQQQSGWRPPASQEELDAIIERRLGRERGSLDKALQAAGFSKLDDAIAAAKAQRDLDAKNKSEVERAQTALTQTQQQAAALAARLRGYEIRDAIGDYLREKHPDYLGRERYIAAIIELGDNADDEALTKAVKKAADQFVKDNPLAPSGAPGSTPGADRSNSGGDATKRQLVQGLAGAMMSAGPMRGRSPLLPETNGRTQ